MAAAQEEPAEPRRGPATGARGRQRRPPLRHLVTEPVRSAANAATVVVGWPALTQAPRGDGHAVLVLPGLLGTDTGTVPLRRYLRALGYDVHGWGLGRNVGPTPHVVTGMAEALRVLSARRGPVSLVGWSLGGIFARELSREHPELVRDVITLGSPFALEHPDASRARGTYERRAGRHASRYQDVDRGRLAAPVPVPCTAVYSRTDGIVAWDSCQQGSGPRWESVEVRCAHLGFGADLATYWVLADRLAQPEGTWRPFVAPRPLRALFPGTYRRSAS